MKKILYIGKICLFISTMQVVAGCSDFLDKQPYTSIADGNFWMTENDAKLALVGCYRVQAGWQNHDFQTSSGLLYLDFAGGHGVDKSGNSTSMASTNTASDNWPIDEYWMNSYGQLAAYNTFLDNIINCPMSEEKKALWSAEVKFLRSYILFNLAFYFKDIPMPLTTLTVEEANSISQTPQAKVYAQLEKDLLEVISVLPTKQAEADYGRATKGAAQVLLSRLYFAQNDFANAAAILKDIIDSEVYEIDNTAGVDSYENLFKIGGEYSREMIFFTQRVKDLYVTAWFQYLYPECYGGWHQNAVYNELIREYFCADGKSIDPQIRN